MGELNKSFPLAPPQAIASFPFAEIAEGTGVTVFLGAEESTGGTATHILTTQTLFSNKQLISTSGSSGTIDNDYDVTFNLPKRIKGDIYVSATIGGTKNSGQGFIHFVAKVRKWDGSTETEIANGQSDTLTLDSSTGQKTMLIRIPITSVQSFKQGETLRLTIELVFSVSSGSFSDVAMGQDPANRSRSGWSTTQLKFHVPFLLDL